MHQLIKTYLNLPKIYYKSKPAKDFRRIFFVNCLVNSMIRLIKTHFSFPFYKITGKVVSMFWCTLQFDRKTCRTYNFTKQMMCEFLILKPFLFPFLKDNGESKFLCFGHET